MLITLPAPGTTGSAYTTYDEIKDRLPDIANMVIPAGHTIQEWVADCISYVGDEIDGRLEGLYVTPFSPTPKLIATIARYFTISMILDPNFVGEIPAESRWSDTNRRNGEALLKRIESGDLVLHSATQVEGSRDLPLSTSRDRARDMTQGFKDSEGALIDQLSGSLDYL